MAQVTDSRFPGLTRTRDIPAGEYPHPDNLGEMARRATAAGSHFFDADTMRFFRSRVHGMFWGSGGKMWGKGNPCVYFVTSERFTHSIPRGSAARLYTVRLFHTPTAEVDTVGEFQGIDSLEKAERVARALALGKLALPLWAASEVRLGNTSEGHVSEATPQYDHRARGYVWWYRFRTEKGANAQAKAAHIAEVLYANCPDWAQDLPTETVGG